MMYVYVCGICLRLVYGGGKYVFARFASYSVLRLYFAVILPRRLIGAGNASPLYST
jgi:hypothetical protein